MNELLERRCVNIEKDQYAGIEKRKLSQEIEQQTAEFLASGRQIYQAPTIHNKSPKPFPPCDSGPSRSELVAAIPHFLKSSKNESGYVGVTRWNDEWVARWRQTHVGIYETAPKAAKAIVDYLEFIGYKPS